MSIFKHHSWQVPDDQRKSDFNQNSNHIMDEFWIKAVYFIYYMFFSLLFRLQLHGFEAEKNFSCLSELSHRVLQQHTAYFSILNVTLHLMSDSDDYSVM